MTLLVISNWPGFRIILDKLFIMNSSLPRGQSLVSITVQYPLAWEIYLHIQLKIVLLVCWMTCVAQFFSNCTYSKQLLCIYFHWAGYENPVPLMSACAYYFKFVLCEWHYFLNWILVLWNFISMFISRNSLIQLIFHCSYILMWVRIPCIVAFYF